MVEDLGAIATFVATTVWRVWPAFLLSVALGVLVRALKLDGAIHRAFSAQAALSIVLATAVGAFSPFCSCTVIPIVSGLLMSGVPLAPVMAFWIASPTMDPEIFALSVATLGWPLAVTRLSATLALSLGAGYITLALTRGGFLSGPILRREPQTDSCCASAAPAPPIPSFVPVAAGAMIPLAAAPVVSMSRGGGCTAASCSVQPAPQPRANDSQIASLIASARALHWSDIAGQIMTQTWSLGRWLLLAFTLEALIVRYVPQAASAATLGGGNGFAVPLAALIGVPLYLNNIGALPIVAELLEQGMQPGAALAFLIAGPVTTIPAMTAVYGVVQRRIFALYLACGLIGAMVLGVIANLLLG